MISDHANVAHVRFSFSFPNGSYFRGLWFWLTDIVRPITSGPCGPDPLCVGVPDYRR